MPPRSFLDSYDHSSHSYVSAILCDYFESSNHDVHNCSYRDYADATCANLGKTIYELIGKMIETMKEKIAKYSHHVNQSGGDNNLHQPNLV